MHQNRIWSILFLLVSLTLVFAGCRSTDSKPYGSAESPRYLRNNIHTQQNDKQEYKASYANWTRPGPIHVIIPVNTPVSISTYRRDLTITTLDTNKTIYFEFDEGNMGMKAEQYIELISSPQPTPLDKLSKIDRKGIQEGKAYAGMTKEGIKIALGYPAIHRTPSLDGNAWVYWKNRWANYAIVFDAHGKVKTIE